MSLRTNIAAAVLSLAVAFAAPPACGGAREHTPEHGVAVGFEGSDAWRKADLRLREAWRNATEEGRSDQRIECLIKAAGPISEGERKALERTGFAARSVAGAIASGDLAAGDLPRVAALSFVEALELAAPMSLKPARKVIPHHPKGKAD